MKPPKSPEQDRAAARDARRAEALRANLRRRKAVDPASTDETAPPAPPENGTGAT